ncbi:MAG: BtpA/SgcQ family protein [Cyanobacteria bacterium P01_H01_bin.74]
MVAKIFGKPKPIIGKVALMPLPGSAFWSSDWELLTARAEQDATTLASAGVDGLMLENTTSPGVNNTRLDHAAAIAIAQLTTSIIQLTRLPVGVSVLHNDPETALAIAVNTGACFIRLSVLAGAKLTPSGIANSRFSELLAYQQQLQAKMPYLLVDINCNQRAAFTNSNDTAFRNPAVIQQSIQSAVDCLPDPLVNNIGFVLNDYDLSSTEFAVIKAASEIPLLVENTCKPQSETGLYYAESDGILLEANIRKKQRFSPSSVPSIDMLEAETFVNKLNNVQPLSEMDADVFLNDLA